MAHGGVGPNPTSDVGLVGLEGDREFGGPAGQVDCCAGGPAAVPRCRSPRRSGKARIQEYSPALAPAAKAIGMETKKVTGMIRDWMNTNRNTPRSTDGSTRWQRQAYPHIPDMSRPIPLTKTA